MTILDPRQFLRVEEKFFPAFALFDDALDTSGLLTVYVALWHFACKRSRPTQVVLARCSKCGLRALQSNLSTLEKRGYIAIRKEGSRNFYDLILSPRVVSELLSQGVEYQKSSFFQPDTQILRIEHANSAPSLKALKSIKKQNTPLSPRSNGPRDTRYRVGSLRPAYHAHGRGDFPHSDQFKPPCRQSPPGDHWSESSFAKLWAAWPVHQAEAPARRAFFSLAQKGALPDVDTLLAVIDRFKTHDFRWQKGGCYVPQLSHWLRDERWRDEPVVASTQAAALEPMPSVAVRQDEMLVYAKEEKGNLTISHNTFALLAKSPWMSKKALDNLQAHCTETAHEQQGKTECAPIPRHGQGGVFGLPAGNSGHAGTGFYANHDLLQLEKCQENNHKPLPVLAALVGEVGQEWNNCSPTSPFTSIFTAPKSGFIGFAPEKAATGAYDPTRSANLKTDFQRRPKRAQLTKTGYR